MFTLAKTPQTITLSYKVSAESRIGFMLAGMAGLAAAMVLGEARGRHDAGSIAALTVICIFAYFMMSDADTTTTFDLVARQLTVVSKRPFFGAPRQTSFDDITSLDVTRVATKTSSQWKVMLYLPGDVRIRLGAETANAKSQIIHWLDDIRSVTGIPK